MGEAIPVFDSSYNNARVEVAGAAFELALPEQPGTGYRWKITSGQTPTADFRDPSGPERGGGGTIRHLRFQTQGHGESTISLQLCRSWEREKAPSKTFTITVVGP
jgi:predicted secreted protein